MKRFSVVVILALVAGLLSVAPASGSKLHEALLRNGNYGSGWAVPTTPPFTVPDPSPPGIVDGPDGVTYISTEADGRSSALINWYIANTADRLQFRNSGTASFCFKADRETHVGGEIFGDNYGFDPTYGGLTALATYAYQVGDQVQITWATTDGSAWDWHGSTNLEYDTWYRIGIAWGPTNKHEIWVDGTLAAEDLAVTVPLPWGVDWYQGSATNVGLGDNHQRLSPAVHGSAAGVMFSDIRIWNEYRPQGDTVGDDVCGGLITLSVPIDIKPGSDPNSINLCSRGVVPMAILGSDTFDASQVVPETVEINGEEIDVRGKKKEWGYLQDVNDDGYTDFVLHIETESLDQLQGATSATLTGELEDGTPIEGTDTVNIVRDDCLN